MRHRGFRFAGGGSGNGSTPDATASSKGVVQLAGDLGGTAAAPTVPGLAAKASTSHTHAEADVTSLTTDLAGKATSAHTHAESDVTSLTTDLSGKASSAHTHALANGQGTPATAAGSLTAGSVNLISGTLVAIPTGSLAVGTRYRFHVGLTKTGAGTATWTLTVRYGTNGNNTDAAIATWTSGTNTALADRAILIVEVVITALGASGTAACIAFYTNQGTDATGLGSISPAPGSTATLNTAATSPFLHVDVQPGASAVMTGWGMAEQVK